MKTTRIAALIFLLLLWLWLCNAIIVGAGGFTFKNIFLIVASGIIIFVPLWKKYIRNGNNNN
ncbi:MAG: hypothetical protein K2M63_07305 [Muribaculaceae bacterium]|nr:hypothetical protein [Bacteroides sp.]MDE6227306.1 hypothetical protein [Muribaculaceae bacterium]